ncbi:GNAT family N-acetyltransferase [Caulobacter segnis]
MAHVADALVARCTQDSFIDRLALALLHIRTVGPVGAPLGFHLINKGDELNQLYVDEAFARVGIAALLMADAEDRLRRAGNHQVLGWPAPSASNVSPRRPFL